MSLLPAWRQCFHHRIKYAVSGRDCCPLCEAEQEIENLRRRLKEAEKNQDRDPLD